MRLIVLDPSLDAYSGHHLSLDLKVAQHFRAQGAECFILANKAFPDTSVEGIAVRPYFQHTAYGTIEGDRYARAHDEFEHFNNAIFKDLRNLPKDFLQPGDILFVPTVTEKILEGIMRWYASLPLVAARGETLRMVVFLMMPSGLYFDHGTEVPRVVDPLTALFYRLALRKAAEASNPVRFIGTGREHAREYTELAGEPVPAFALMADASLDRTAARETLKLPAGGRLAVLYAGDCKADKGFSVLPAVTEQLCSSYPEWTFVIHFNTRAAWGKVLDDAQKVRQLAEIHDNCILHEGFLPPGTYQQIIASADLVLIPYDREHYRAKSSGILWEALNAGCAVLCPDDCWLEKELAAWGGAGKAYAGSGAQQITAAFSEILQDFDAEMRTAAKAATEFQRANGLETLQGLMMDDAPRPHSFAPNRKEKI